ncbi:hypothetical protein ANANG_G00087810 [Anguilla anguilla]|uniref:Uncharacterized protein n=1 Tax=Anguilla anguilla TaxID=7936 RepID=A0A9D3S0S1_ANGAN|nr:hypothetical protein ANANG_G00087810 [Anguilla anguilla]
MRQLHSCFLGCHLPIWESGGLYKERTGFDADRPLRILKGSCDQRASTLLVFSSGHCKAVRLAGFQRIMLKLSDIQLQEFIL